MKKFLFLITFLLVGFSVLSQEKSLTQKEVKPQTEQNELKKERQKFFF